MRPSRTDISSSGRAGGLGEADHRTLELTLQIDKDGGPVCRGRRVRTLNNASRVSSGDVAGEPWPKVSTRAVHRDALLTSLWQTVPTRKPFKRILQKPLKRTPTGMHLDGSSDSRRGRISNRRSVRRREQ